VSDLRSLNLDNLRDWVGDFEIGKARPYVHAVAGCVRAGNTIKASVRGSRPRAYRVWVRTGDLPIEAAHCTCPVGAKGTCKHVAAVLLAYLEHPGRFAVLDDIDANLAGRSKPELVALVKALLHQSPELEPLLVRPLPGFATVTPDQTAYYFLALDAVRPVNLHDDWAPQEIAADLTEVVEYARGFGTGGEPPAEVFLAIAQVLREELGAAHAAEVVAALPAAIRIRLQIEDQSGDPVAPPF
jgi:uncharacterized Zn finger protein